MIRIAIITTYLLCAIKIICAQEVVVSGGNFHQNASGSISWSLGETAILTLRAGDNIITQGFHQTKLTVTSVNEIPGLKMIISAFPNPANDHINLKVDGSIENLTFLVYDLNGRIVKRGNFDANPIRISFQELGSAMYFIRVLHNNQELKTFRVIKQ